MRFLPINLDNVKNAAALYVAIGNKEPWNGKWNYSTAYARLSSIVKCVGFSGYISMDENGFPAGFLMGHTEARSDGNYDFILRELCFAATVSGRNLAAKTLEYLIEEINRHSITRLILYKELSPATLEYFRSLGFQQIDTVTCMERSI
ncbi:MAG: hypothetical protein GX541_01905 [Clostridiales bacterium]|jgi:hypothetical protein|nr:hypothetical protein [Clostridiales bacterium]